MRVRTQSLFSNFENPFFVVVLLLAGLFVAGPFLSGMDRWWADMISATVAGFALALGIVAAKPGPFATRLGLVLALIVIVAAAFGGEGGTLSLISRIGFSGVSMIALVTILGFVLRARSVRGEEIFAAIAAYMLLGFFFSYLYIALHGSGLDAPAFTGLAELNGTVESKMIYFSFVTLTTLGYGDVSPVNDYARSLATFEAMTGQLFIAVLLARLVALQTMNSSKPEAS